MKTARAALILALALCLAPRPAHAQTGVDDDRVSLPEGPGSLEGVGDDVEIDPNMGSMSFTVPIELPKGFPAASPNLTLSYGSGAGSGPVGIGWSLAVPAIERMTSRGVPTYTTDDFFDLGGQELVRVDDGQDPTELVYRARFEKEFKRFRWIDAADGADGYWIVDHPDGSTSYYGANSDGNLVASARSTHPDGGTARYLLVETVDAFGHSVRYEYDDFGSSWPLLTTVSWVDDGSGFLLYTATLSWEDRPDYLSDASVGFEELLTKRLATLTVRAANEIVREYVLSYQDDTAAGGFSRLERVVRYGLGGRASGNPAHPNQFTFEYSQALGIDCQSGMDCDDVPLVVDMGTIPGAVDLGAGKATLIDINADGLPDVLDTTDPNGHIFYLNTLTPNGESFDHGFSAALETALPEANMQLGEAVQVFDVDGDGLSDLLNTTNGSYLLNTRASADWGSAGSFVEAGPLVGVDFAFARFIDIDDDKRVDVLTSTASTTIAYMNEGDHFDTVTLEPLGALIGGGSTLQFADMNGDGLNDPVQLSAEGLVSYRLNLGHGRWTAWRVVSSVSVATSERALMDLEDLNGDGLSDVVVVTGAQVKYALNRNGERFDAFRTLTSASLGTGQIPDRTGKTVLYADMNANGSEDVVWFDASGRVTYLELFPVRPNLLTRIDNGLGSIQRIDYGTAAEHTARAAAAGEPWSHLLPIPMQVVDAIDLFVTVTGAEDGSGLHNVTSYEYRDGFYDGAEKQYRGFEDVSFVTAGDAYQETGTTRHLFDVGREAPWRNGLQLSTTLSGDESGLIEIVRSEFDACPLGGVPEPADLETLGRKGVYWPCQLAAEIVHVEGSDDESQWITTRTEFQYDGYGNTTLTAKLGDIAVTGDEDYTSTTFVAPTDTHWLLRLPVRELHSASADFAQANETVSYYDGDDFVGLDEGLATHGFLSRQTKRVDDTTLIEATRNARDAHGNIAVVLEPNGTLDGTDHRRTYTYDPTGLFLTTTDIHLGDYLLRRETRFEQNFQKLVEATEWMRVENGEIVTARDSSTYRYDDFGRLTETLGPGDDADKPSQRIAWELGEPWSRVILQLRSVQNGIYDEEMIRCFDGRGRRYQERRRVGAGSYVVTGFDVFNRNGTTVETFEPYLSNSDACEDAPPEGTRSTTWRFDAKKRELEKSEPGEEIYGERVLTRTEYLPLEVVVWDPEDLAEGGPHAGTPTRKTMDGIDRLAAITRTFGDEAGALHEATVELLYDETNSFAGYVDPAGHRHELTVDLAGRVTRVSNPNLGVITYQHDDFDNVVATTDARGVTVRTVYDGTNRILERYEDGNRESTLVTWHYDTLPADCELTECTNLGGQLAMVSYPVDLGNGRIEQGSDRFGYDVRRQQVFVGRRFGLLADLVTTFEYDNQDRITATIHPDGTRIETTYDLAGRLTAMPGYLTGVAYEPRGQWETLELANGARLTRTFDALQREIARTVTGGDGQLLLGHALTRNRLGALTAIEDTAVLEGIATAHVRYERDDWYRVTGADYGDGDEMLAWTYDELDRITSATSSDTNSPAHVGELTYDDARPLAVTGAGSMALAYDASGNLTSRGDATMTRDELGRLDGVSRADGARAWMVYADDARAAQIAEADGTLVLYAPTGSFELRDGVARAYVKMGREAIARVESTALAASIYPNPDGDSAITAADAYLALQQGDESLSTRHVLAAAAARLLVEHEAAGEPTLTTFLHADYLGSIVVSTDDGGELRGVRGFYPYGQERFAVGHVDAYGFTGAEHDTSSTGLVHLGKRELDPVTGRWDRFDPYFVTPDAKLMEKLGEAAAGFAYTANNPLDYVDPSGEIIIAVAAIVAVGIIAAIAIRKGGKAEKKAKDKRRKKKLEKKHKEKVDKALGELLKETGNLDSGAGGGRGRSGAIDEAGGVGGNRESPFGLAAFSAAYEKINDQIADAGAADVGQILEDVKADRLERVDSQRQKSFYDSKFERSISNVFYDD